MKYGNTSKEKLESQKYEQGKKNKVDELADLNKYGATDFL